MNQTLFKYCCLFILLFVLNKHVNAQRQIRLGNQLISKRYYNPAAIAEDNNIDVISFYQITKDGENSSLKSFDLFADMLINIKESQFGTALNIFNSYNELKNITEFTSALSWIKSIQSFQIRAGVSLILRNLSFDGRNINHNNEIDSTYLNYEIPDKLISDKSIDLGFGFYMSWYKFSAGLSMRNILNSNIQLTEKYILTNFREYNMMLGYQYSIYNDKLKFIPSAIFSVNDNINYNFDLSLISWYNNKIHFDFLYRYNYSLGGGVGLRIKQFNVGYRFDWIKNRNLNFSNHEFFVSYAIKLLFIDNNKSELKSVQLL